MIIIADSGSTKTDWVLLNNSGDATSMQSKGLNPVFLTENEIEDVIKETFSGVSFEKHLSVYFYGAGCIKGKTSEKIESVLQKFFNTVDIFVEDDMLGAARSLFGNSPGIACILGTGANSGLYNGEKFIEKIPALGFILGDEGSGAVLGKALINSYFKKSLSPDLEKKFEAQFNPDMAEIINAVYRKQFPNRYLASFSIFLKENIQYPEIHKIVYENFLLFFERNVMKYTNYPHYKTGITGSIGFYYSDILQEIALIKGINLTLIEEKPISGLIKYHTK